MKSTKSIFVGSCLALTLILAGCTSTADPVVKSDGDNNPTKQEVAKKDYQNLKIGETVVLGDGSEITLNSVTKVPGSQFQQPSNGKFLVVDVTIVNNSDKEMAVSSILEYEMKDAEGYGYTTAIVIDGVKSQLDGSVIAGGKLRGQIAYDVPESEYYEFTHSEVFSGKTSVWKITPGEIQ